MAKTKMLTVTVENTPGAVAHVAAAMGKAKVNILALFGTAHGTVEGDAGPVHLVVEDVKRAKKVLDYIGLAYEETEAVQHELANKPGALAQYLRKLTLRSVNLTSIGATAVKGGKKAVVVYTVHHYGTAVILPTYPVTRARVLPQPGHGVVSPRHLAR